MAWIYLAESEELPSACPPGSIQSPTVSRNRFRNPFYYHARLKDYYRQLANEIRPWFVFLENPKGTLRWINEITKAFRDIGYIIEPDDHGIIGLWELGAPHSRERWFALAHAEGLRLERLEQQQKGEQNVWKGGQRS